MVAKDALFSPVGFSFLVREASNGPHVCYAIQSMDCLYYYFDPFLFVDGFGKLYG